MSPPVNLRHCRGGNALTCLGFLALYGTSILWGSTGVSATHLQPKDFFGGGTDNEAFLAWYGKSGGNYEGFAFLEGASNTSSNGAALLWRVDATHINVAVAAKATGWIGLGLSENGGMQGADLLLFQASKPQQVKDGYILKDLVPLEDECNHWEYVSSQVVPESNFLLVEARRLTDTGDLQDRRIMNDSDSNIPASRIIAAWGDSETVSYHGPKNRAKGMIRWYGDAVSDDDVFAQQMLEESDGFFEMRADNTQIHVTPTDYQNFCFTWDDLLAKDVPNNTFSVIGFRPLLDKVQHVHHFTLFGSYDTMNGKSCHPDFDKVYEMVYAWGFGEPPTALPREVGLYLGYGSSSFKSFRLLIHYDNTQLEENVVDSSGIRLYYTTTMRPYELGLVQIGDPGVMLENQTLPVGKSEYSFFCPSTCTEVILKQNVTVIREYMHMHNNGQTMKLEQIRNGQVIHTGRVDFFDFAQQGNQAVQGDTYTVMKGDAFRTTCDFDTNGKSVVFGFGSMDEMCIAVIMYYPKQTFLGLAPWFCDPDPSFGFSPCVATLENKSIDVLPRTFGTVNTTECSVVPDTSGVSLFKALRWVTMLGTVMLVLVGWA